MSLNTNTLPASDSSTEKRSICLINDSFPPVIDGVANAVTNYASVIQRSYGDATVVTPYYPDADDSIYPFPVLRYPSIDVTKLVGYRAGLPLSPELMAQVEERHIDLIHSHCPVTSTILARMLRQRLHVPLVFTYHTKFDIDISNAIHSKHLQEASISCWWRTSPPAMRYGQSAAAQEKISAPWAIRETTSSCPTAWTFRPIACRRRRYAP